MNQERGIKYKSLQYNGKGFSNRYDIFNQFFPVEFVSTGKTSIRMKL